MSAQYTFGTSEPAAERLLVVAHVFDPTMAAVLSSLPRRRWRRVLDLGCGPASSTERLAAHLEIDELLGVDASDTFCAAARMRLPMARFLVGDVLAPFPVDAPDLVYARYLLSHLPSPCDVARRWAAQLAPGGYLVLEEPERIETSDEVFAAYLALTASVVRSRGAEMFVGPALASLGGVVNRVHEHPVSSVDAATMFSLNLATVRNDPWVHTHHAAGELDELAAALDARRSGAVRVPDVGWRIRQVVLGSSSPLRRTA